jgi:protein-tyrosine-phosphatase
MVSILFVCLGNICRSPLAEGVFLKLLEERGLTSSFKIDSAGTSGYHEGEPAHKGSLKIAQQFNTNLPSRSRQVNPTDFKEFDYLVAMDVSNQEDLNILHESYGMGKGPKILRLLEFDQKKSGDDVRDPYGYGDDVFLDVYKRVKEGCEGLLDFLIEKHELDLLQK